MLKDEELKTEESLDIVSLDDFTFHLSYLLICTRFLLSRMNIHYMICMKKILFLKSNLCKC